MQTFSQSIELNNELIFHYVQSQISVQRLGTRFAVCENLARHLRRSRLPLIEGSLHYPRLIATWSWRANHQRRRSLSSVAETRWWVPRSHQHEKQSIVDRRSVRAGMVRQWFRGTERRQQSIRHDVKATRPVYISWENETKLTSSKTIKWKENYVIIRRNHSVCRR